MMSNILFVFTYQASISFMLDKCLPSIVIGFVDISGGVLSIFIGRESAVELLPAKSIPMTCNTKQILRGIYIQHDNPSSLTISPWISCVLVHAHL